MMTEIEKLYEQYMLTVKAFDAARADAGEIAQAVKARIAQERERDRLRLEELEGISTGAAAKIASIEREEIAGKVYTATAAEIAAHEEAIAAMQQAETELRSMRGSFRGFYKAAVEELDRMRAEVVGDQAAEIRSRWIEGDRRKFEAML